MAVLRIADLTAILQAGDEFLCFGSVLGVQRVPEIHEQDPTGGGEEGAKAHQEYFLAAREDTDVTFRAKYLAGERGEFRAEGGSGIRGYVVEQQFLTQGASAA